MRLFLIAAWLVMPIPTVAQSSPEDLMERAVAHADTAARFLRQFAGSGASNALMGSAYHASVSTTYFFQAGETQDSLLSDIRDGVWRLTVEIPAGVIDGLRRGRDLPQGDRAGLRTYAEIVQSMTHRASTDDGGEGGR